MLAERRKSLTTSTWTLDTKDIPLRAVVFINGGAPLSSTDGRIHSHQPRATAGMHTEVSAVREDSSILALQRAFCASVRDREHSRGCELGLNGRTLLTT